MSIMGVIKGDASKCELQSKLLRGGYIGNSTALLFRGSGCCV